MKKLGLSFLLVMIGIITSAQEKYKLVPTAEYASCTDYALYQKVDLPREIANALVCANIANIHGDNLTFMRGDSVIIYNLRTKKQSLLFVNYPDIDGISGPVWSPSGDKLMFVIINQQQKHGYRSFARIIVLTIDKNNSVIRKQKFDRPVNFVCAGDCFAQPDSDFFFKDDNTIGYRRNENISDRPGQIEYIKL